MNIKSELELELAIPFDSIWRVPCTFCVPKLFSLSRKVLSKAILNWCKLSKMLKANSGEGRWWPELAHPEGTFARECASMSYKRFCQMSSNYSTLYWFVAQNFLMLKQKLILVKNPSIFNIICWFAGPMHLAFQVFIVSYRLRALKTLYSHFCNFIRN